MRKSISQLNMLSPEEYGQVVRDFNNTTIDYPKDKCVHTLFEEQVAKTPDKVAVIACDRTLTYSELNEQANIIAHSLISSGIKQGDIVTLVLSRNSLLICAMLGVLKAGAAYMPIVTDYPQERIDYMVKDCGAKLVLTDKNILEYSSGSDIENLNIEVSFNSDFCVLHTSGSTGMPKCAALKHINMTNFAYSNKELLNGIDYVIAINAVTFDVFEMDTIFALLFGNTCVLASETEQFVQKDFEAMMSKYKNCLFWATPTKMQNYIDNSPTKAFMKNINCYIVGGEVVTEQFIQKVASCNEKLAIYTVYGPTETLIYSTMQQLKVPGTVETEGALLKDISSLSQKEYETLRYTFNDTAADYPREKCVHTAFEEQAASLPGRTAVVACDKTLTYGELNEQANRIAHSLIEKGIQPGDIVAFMLPRRSYLLSAMFGILKSGAAYLPIDPDYPQDRIDYMLTDSGAKLCITEENLPELLTNENKENPDVQMTSDSLCYCIYTSGSTGLPKGTAITHKNVENFCNLQNENHFASRFINSCDCVASTNSISFDIILQEIHLPLLNGCPVLLLSSTGQLRAEEIKLLQGNENLGLITTPVKITALLLDEEFRKAMKNMSVIMIGADVLNQSLVDDIRELTAAEIINGYGPTETTCGVSYAQINLKTT